MFSGLAVDEMKQGVRSIARAMLSLSGAPTNGPVAPSFELPGGAWPETPYQTLTRRSLASAVC